VAVGPTTAPSPPRSVCTSVSVTLNGAVTSTRGAAASVEPVTATLPVAPVSVHSGAPPLPGAAVGQRLLAAGAGVPSSVRADELAAPEDVLAEGAVLSELHAASVMAADAAQATSAAEEYTRREFTDVTLHTSNAVLAGSPIRRDACRRLRADGGDTENVMRWLDDVGAQDRMRWLAGEHWPAFYGSGPGATGYDPSEGWGAAVWVLHAMYEKPDIDPGLSHHELHQQAIALGLREPTIVGGINLDESTTTTGQTLGFQKKPEPQWLRLTWSELGQRDGFEFWAVAGRWPDLRYTPRSDWADPATMPASAGPRIGPTTESSWPASILPPPRGSLDEESLLALIEVLAQHTAPAALADCGAYHGPVAFMGEGAAVYAGRLDDVPALVASQHGTAFTPNNVWPADQSWLIYTDHDLEATRVSGSTEVIDALCADDRIETVRCSSD
jgi:hypothetical protein